MMVIFHQVDSASRWRRGATARRTAPGARTSGTARLQGTKTHSPNERLGECRTVLPQVPREPLQVRQREVRAGGVGVRRRQRLRRRQRRERGLPREGVPSRDTLQGSHTQYGLYGTGRDGVEILRLFISSSVCLG